MASLSLRSSKSSLRLFSHRACRFYHDYVRLSTQGSSPFISHVLPHLPSPCRWGGPRSLELSEYHRRSIFSRQQKACDLSSSSIVGFDCWLSSHQEDYYAFASLSLNVDGLRQSIRKSLGLEWIPECPKDPIARQVVFIGLYDGLVPYSPIDQILMHVTADMVVQQYLSSCVRNCMASLNPSTRRRSLNFSFGSRIRAVISRDSPAALLLLGYTTQNAHHRSIWSHVLLRHFLKLVSLTSLGLKQI